MKTEVLGQWLPLAKLLRCAPRFRGMRLALAGWHFQVDAISLVHDHIWDGTSLLLRKVIRRYSRDDQRVLDIGTGHLGLLAVFCARIHNVEMVAVDVNEEFLENAQVVATASGVSSIEFRKSDWFSNVDGTFDLIFGNVPYIPTCFGEIEPHLDNFPEIWDGGRDGLEHARCILAEVDHFLNPGGFLLLGINATYVPTEGTLSLIETFHGLALKEIVKSWFSGNEVYVIGHKTENRMIH
jgi:release factor glutamine methyltransferase